MKNEPTSRRLAAILAADVVGYSRLMAKDEIATLAALNHHRRDVFNPAVAQFRGRVFKLMGDGTLVEFASVVDAVNCAIAIQKAADAADGGSGPQIVLRIGVHLGDVILDGDDIYGDGVNIAARLEPLAEPGGLCISSIVKESVGNRAEVAFRDGGKVSVKNIDEPLSVWHWPATQPPMAAKSEVPSAEKKPVPQETGHSIAVLPFENRSGDAEQEYFSDGISEDIITDLSKVEGLLVIARNSSFSFKGKSIDLRDVGKELGVNFILEGSVRRAGDRVRITAQLINIVTGGHLWAERYDRVLTDIFAVQDDVTQQIVDALKLNLSRSETPSSANDYIPNVQAHDLFLRGRSLAFGTKRNADMFKEAKSCFERAKDLDPEYAAPYAGLAMIYMLDHQNHWSDSPETSLKKARELIDISISRDGADPFSHYVSAVVSMWKKDYDGWRAEADKALVLNPNFAPALNVRGTFYTYTGQPLKAIPAIEKAIRMDPVFKEQYLHFLGLAYFVAKDYEKAMTIFQNRISINPATDLSRAFLASALGHLDRGSEARQIWKELKAVNPNYSSEQHASRMPFRDTSEVQYFFSGLSKAGLIE